MVLQINLSYDLLSENGIKAHIYPGRPFYIRRENSRSHIAQLLLRESITGFTLSPGHLFAYGLFSEDIKNGVSRHFFFYKMNRLANALYREKFCNVSDKCLESSYEELFADYIYFAKKNAYIEYNQKKYYGTNKLYEIYSPLDKLNLYYQHYLELAPLHISMNHFWREVDEHD